MNFEVYWLSAVVVAFLAVFAVRQWILKPASINSPYRITLLPKLGDNFDPAEAMDVNKTTILAQICAKLTYLGGDLQVTPDLAKSWAIDESRTKYTSESYRRLKTSIRSRLLQAFQVAIYVPLNTLQLRSRRLERCQEKVGFSVPQSFHR